MSVRHYFMVLLGILISCAIGEESSTSEKRANVREALVLRIEKQIADMVHVSRDWEDSQFRTYQRRDIDGDGIDDAVLLTTFEHDNGWRRELFVCLSSDPGKVLHMNLGGKWERMAEEVEVKDRKIIIRGKKYVLGDAGCCPSQPYESTFFIANGKIVEKQ